MMGKRASHTVHPLPHNLALFLQGKQSATPEQKRSPTMKERRTRDQISCSGAAWGQVTAASRCGGEWLCLWHLK